MKSIFDYIQKFQFKNFLAMVAMFLLFHTLWEYQIYKDVILVLLTLLFKHYWDSNTGAASKDATISKALDQAQQLPAVGSPTATTESGDINLKK